jgi:hypothetical protein
MSAGKIQQVGTAKDIYTRPVNRFVASFIGETNFLTGTAEAGRVRLAPATGSTCPTCLPATRGARSRWRCGPNRSAWWTRSEAGVQARHVGRDGLFRHRHPCHLVLSDGVEVVARLQSPATGDAGWRKGRSRGCALHRALSRFWRIEPRRTKTPPAPPKPAMAGFCRPRRWRSWSFAASGPLADRAGLFLPDTGTIRQCRLGVFAGWLGGYPVVKGHLRRHMETGRRASDDLLAVGQTVADDHGDHLCRGLSDRLVHRHPARRSHARFGCS